MSTFKFDSIIKEFPKFDKGELYLWVWNANKIPPHLGISLGKEYFSLTYKGVDDYPNATMIRKIRRSEIPTLFIKIDAEITEDPGQIFNSFERAKPGGATCLSPIKSVLEVPDELKQLSSLLEELTNTEKLSSVYGVYLPEDYDSLPVYGWSDIVSRIEVLNAEK